MRLDTTDTAMLLNYGITSRTLRKMHKKYGSVSLPVRFKQFPGRLRVIMIRSEDRQDCWIWFAHREAGRKITSATKTGGRVYSRLDLRDNDANGVLEWFELID